MASVRVLDDTGVVHSVETYSIECPFCHSLMTPQYLCVHDYSMFAMCSNGECGEHMVLTYDNSGRFTRILPNARPKTRSFSRIIKDTSSSFEGIYNQALCAEQMSLGQICGPGYRKALEYLIKDYLLLEIEDEAQRNKIKNKFLGACIQENVVDERIKAVAKRAVWLGNDETHYVRKWLEKDVTNLKQLIDLTVRWIENEVETKRLLEDMPECL